MANVVPRLFLKPNWYSLALSSGIILYSISFVCTELSVNGLFLDGILESSVGFFNIGIIKLFCSMSGIMANE